MQFSIIIAAFAAAASAQYSNGTSVVAPSGTAAPSGTGSAAPSSTAPFEGAAIANGPAMAVLIGAGAVALFHHCFHQRDNNNTSTSAFDF
ncbi:hypothetical protein P171DRAFT_488491 [Karstenula rhodostoma CBS 690.94]|uniref:Uncharacterized protein n=1 Tax=Karstenula rhodostoma CBS 690.94 TaxID=1392251 RepID=A0A9P4PBR3_9PLEO|nr:hypothetical protein P171DRAFT_488491 [Karstenula rhodostoma CBS 690.94]